MAPMRLKTVALILALTACVGAMTLSVHVPTAVAATGSSGSTNGDPDSPKDSAPRQSSANPQVMVGTVVSTQSLGTTGSVIRWILARQIMSALLGRPGLMR
jgi:hypothetical protein